MKKEWEKEEEEGDKPTPPEPIVDPVPEPVKPVDP